jgi:hypothetical protein
MRIKIAKLLLSNKRYQLSELGFWNTLSKDEKTQCLAYVTDGTVNDIDSIREKLPRDMGTIFALRGILGFGVFEHCLEMRVGIDFGAPGDTHQNNKRVGIPYEAADVPSKRS